MTPAEVRAVVERVVVEHGKGWHIRRLGSLDVHPPGDWGLIHVSVSEA